MKKKRVKVLILGALPSIVWNAFQCEIQTREIVGISLQSPSFRLCCSFVLLFHCL